ncbi:Zinc finger protein [Trichinella pseudospiralis]|uniref:Zinc finger protein n=2 Tax=Trichinella pseudospiralis TaxID=6337 RepID=A0A0V1I9V6_TRIPS|nr:Zinc finger protein [Trichinella pseudospiralis]
MRKKRFCESCNRQFSSSYKYKIMAYISHNERLSPACVINMIKQIKCIMHMNIHLGMKPYACQMCGTRFSNQGAKHNHMRIHSCASPFACSLCKKAFALELSLKNT